MRGIDGDADDEETTYKFSLIDGVLGCSILVGSSDGGESNRVASLQFASREEAQRAIDKYSGKVWEGKMIELRHRRETLLCSAEQPLIVNGSR